MGGDHAFSDAAFFAANQNNHYPLPQYKNIKIL
jgi:hypothetical protein